MADPARQASSGCRVNTLADELRQLIQTEGPISIEHYMALCLGHPRLGYYMTRDPIGAAGDFTTAPEISQMFGELIGLFAAQAWLDLGQPNPVQLIECGPGRGTLMADMLRACKALPAFRAALSVHMVETSPVLQGIQKHALEAASVPVQWVDRLDAVAPGAPFILVANEFLDALPIRQYVRQNNQWHERLVGISEDRLACGLAPEPEKNLVKEAPEGSVFELAPSILNFVAALSKKLVAQGGVALLIDYGHLQSGLGDTLQAMREHAFVDPLAAPGQSDLTAHVDFATVAAVARQNGAVVHPPLTQAEFLQRLGIEERAAVLIRGAKHDAQRATIASELARLTDPSKLGMGELFKVIAITGPGQPVPPAFETKE
ncbi:MAG: class I SAM-dependent methyltransferase [Beijerinckiaceae bacterium]